MRGIREQLRRLPRRRFIRFASAGAVFLCLGAASLILHAHAVVERCGSRVSDSIDAIEPREVGLLLGTAPDGRYGPNAYFQYRIEAAAALYHAGKVRKIIVSGDNSRKEYNEPAAMRRALEKKGVKPEDIFEDFAGFRTLDSVIRARRVFGQTRLTIISQEFHCKRALYLAGRPRHRRDRLCRARRRTEAVPAPQPPARSLFPRARAPRRRRRTRTAFSRRTSSGEHREKRPQRKLD